MTRFLGLRGKSLNMASILGVAMPTHMLVGYNLALLGGVLTLRSFEEQFPEMDVINANPADRWNKSILQGTVVALFTIGALLGALSCIGLGDILGRRRVIMVSAALQLLGTIVMASASSFAHLIVSRVIIGLGVGGLLATVPVWQAEISPAAKRGTHVSTSGIFASIGGLFALALDLGMSFAPGSIGWRFPMAFQALLSLMTTGFMWFLPESPRWLIRQNRVAEAREVLTALEAIYTNHPGVEAEIQAVQSSLNQGKASSSQVFQMGPQRIFHRAIIASSLLMFVQCAGINVVGLYTNTIFEGYLKLDSVTSRVLGVVYQIVSIVGGIVCVFTVDGLGRRTLMLSSAAGNAICMALVAGLGSRPENTEAIHGSVVFIFLFHFTFIVGFAGVPLLYASEIAPLRMRGTINGISISTLWAFSFLIAEITPIAFEAIGWRFFIVFATSNVIIMAAIYLFFPETAGRTLEEIDQIFISSKTIWEPVWVASQFSRSTPGEFQGKEGHTSMKGCV